VLPSISAFISYSVEGKVARERHLFGKGAMEGIAGPEAANNATAVAGFIPLMALGIPTGPVMAIVLAALLVHGVIPGPLMFTTHKTLTSAVIASFFIGNVILVILNVPLVGIWVRLAMIPYRILAPIILALCFWGAYCIRNSVFDIWVAVGFGLLGYVMKRYNLPAAPFVLGFILGDPIELHLRQVMALGPFSLTLQHPIAVTLLACAGIVIILYTAFREKREVVAVIEED